MFPIAPRTVFESFDIGRIDNERIYIDCVDTVVEDKNHKQYST